MRTQKASRHEVALIAALVAVVVIGAGVYWGVMQVQNAEYQQRIEDSTVVVNPGETHNVSASQSPWDGTMEITLTRSAWYESFDDAQRAEDLGDVSDYAEGGDGG